MTPLDTTTVIIEWLGPFTMEELKKRPEGNGLYLLTGIPQKSRAKSDKLLYCGITEKLFCERIRPGHHAVKQIKPETLRVWIGCLVYPTECVRQHLEDAEGAFVSFWDVMLNARKKKFYPAKAICIVARWCKKDGKAYKRWSASLAFIKALDDVLWWDTEDWRVGNLSLP